MTTIIAFLSGISGGVGPVRDFSLLCAAGIFSSFILTILFYTSMRYILDSSQASETGFLSNDKDKLSVAGSDFIESSIYRVSSLVDSYPKCIVSAVVIVTLLALGGAAQINTSFSINDFLSDDLPIMVTGEDIQNDFRGADYLQSQILIAVSYTHLTLPTKA